MMKRKVGVLWKDNKAPWPRRLLKGAFHASSLIEKIACDRR
jgi:hypothetical protein